MKRIDLVEISNIITRDNPDIKIASIENNNWIVTVTILYKNNYYELCKIDVNKCKVYINKFLEIYDNITINKKELLNVAK